MGAASRRLASTFVLMLALAGFLSHPAGALDKQTPSRPREEDGGGAEPGVGLDGELFLGVLPFNPTYAARPDNSGRALLRAGGHLDVSLWGPRLFIPLDLNIFTDRTHAPMRPSEIDVIAGVASGWELPVGRGELGARGEMDAPADGMGASQFYGDVRARYLWSLAAVRPAAALVLAGGDVAAALTLGWFAWNHSYFARPDNTGLALLRYALNLQLGLGPRVALFGDGTCFTDRTVNAMRPSELDLTTGVAVVIGGWRLQAAYERDMPVDGRGTGLVQHMALLQGAWTFGWHRAR
jgi:hypothetical protein